MGNCESNFCLVCISFSTSTQIAYVYAILTDEIISKPLLRSLVCARRPSKLKTAPGSSTCEPSSSTVYL